MLQALSSVDVRVDEDTDRHGLFYYIIFRIKVVFVIASFTRLAYSEGSNSVWKVLESDFSTFQI